MGRISGTTLALVKKKKKKDERMVFKEMGLTQFSDIDTND